MVLPYYAVDNQSPLNIFSPGTQHPKKETENPNGRSVRFVGFVAVGWGADHTRQFRHHPSASPAVIVRKVVGHHLFLNVIPNNFTAKTERKVWCDRGMMRGHYKPHPVPPRRRPGQRESARRKKKEQPHVWGPPNDPPQLNEHMLVYSECTYFLDIGWMSTRESTQNVRIS